MAIQYYADKNSQDDVKVTFGDSSDLQIYHDGTNSYIENDTGDLYIRSNFQDRDIILQSDDGGGGIATYIQLDGSTGVVNLNHYGSNKLKTTSTGVTVTGGAVVAGAMSSFETTLTNNEDWENSPISILERGNVQATESADKYAPNLNFHWGGVTSKSLWVGYNGQLNFGEYSAAGIPSSDGRINATTFNGDHLGTINTATTGTTQTAGDNSTKIATTAYADAAAGAVDPSGVYLPLVGGTISGTPGTLLISGLSNYTGLTVKGSGASRPAITWSNVTQGDLGIIYGTENNALVIGTGASGTAALTLDSSQDSTFTGSVDATLFKASTDSGININGLTMTRVAANSAIRVSDGLETLGLLRSYAGLNVATTGTFGGLVSGIAPVADLNFATKKYVDDSITGGANYLGTWDPDDSLNSGYGNPSLEASGRTDDSGDYFICSADGAAHPNGGTSEPDSWNTGDWVIWNEDLGTGGLWQKLDNTTVLSGAGTTNSVAKFTDSETIGDGPITFSSNDSTFAGNITAVRGFFDAGATNVVATFTSSDATSTLQCVDGTGNVEFGASGNSFVVQPAGGAAKFTLDTNYGYFTTLGGIQLQSDSSVFVAGSSATNGARMTHNGTDAYFLTASGDLRIYNNAQDKDIILRGNDGGSSTVALTLDMSEAGYATFNSGAIFGGLVSGITPTAAANFATKAYVDGLTPGAGVFLPLAGGTLTGNTNLTGSTKKLILKSGAQLGFEDAAPTGTIYLYNDGAATSRLNIGGTMWVEEAGDVGIGTASPGAKLEVVGGTRLGGGVCHISTDTSYSTGFSYTFRDAVGINNPNSVSAPAVAGYVMSVGRSTSGSVSGGIYVEGESRFVRGLAGAINFNAYDAANQTGTPTYMLGTDASGNVVKVLGGNIPGGGGTVTGTGVATRVAFWSGTSSLSADSNLYWDDTNDRLGIGTTSPVCKLDVQGPDTDNAIIARFYSSEGSRGDFIIRNGSSTAPTTYIGTGGGNEELSIGTEDTNAIYIDNQQLVGIGNTGPAHKLDVTGDIYSSGQMLTKGSSMASFTVLGDLDTGLGNFDGKGRVSLVSDNKAEITVDKGTIAFDNYTATAVATTGSLIPNQGNQAVTEDTLALLAVDPDGNVVRGSQEGTWTFTKAQLDALATTTSGGTQLIQAPGANKAVIVEESNWMIKYSGTGSMSQNGFEIRQSTVVLADAGISRIPSGQINNIMNSAQGTPTNPSYGFYARDLPQYNNDGRTYKTNAQTVLMRINTNATPANLVSISIKLKYRLFDAATF